MEDQVSNAELDKIDNGNIIKKSVEERSSIDDVEYKPGESRRIVRNVFILSISFTLLFTSNMGMGRLQSSINTERGLGNWSLATTSIAIVVSSLFLPTFLIHRFTVKRVMIVSMLGHVVYIGAQFYPAFYTLIPTGIIVGICGAPLWAAKCCYISHISKEYMKTLPVSAEVVMTKFFGIFFFSYQTQGIWGNLISSTILSIGVGNSTRDTSVCGSSFCPADAQSGGAIQSVSKTKIYTLAGVYLVVGLMAAGVVAIFLDSLGRYGERKSKASLTCDKFIATFSQLKNPLQLLIVPLTIWSGLQTGFYASDFFQAYVTCAWGVHNLGYVGICYAVCDSLGSLAWSYLIKWSGRFPIFVVGTTLSAAMIVFLFTWQPSPTTPIMFFIFAAGWGIADSVWQTQINALYGTLFPYNKEAAFSNYRLWESLGVGVAFSNANLLCVDQKLYILMSFLIVGMTGYLVIEIVERRRDAVKPK